MTTRSRLRNRYTPVRLALLAVVLAIGACAVSPTGRNQLLFFPEGEMAQMGAAAFTEQKQGTPISKDRKATEYVQCVSARLLKAMGEKPADWEVVLFDSEQVNAYALPGRKIGVYTGLLAVADNQDRLAAVVGHEIGHVIARHSNERMSTQYATATGLQLVQALAGSENTQQKQLLMAALGLGAQYGVILPWGRTQESEADRIGLDLMARAGFDPRESVALWQAMSRANGKQPPEFLSTHPSNDTRISNLEAGMAAALATRKQALKKSPAPDCRR